MCLPGYIGVGIPFAKFEAAIRARYSVRTFRGGSEEEARHSQLAHRKVGVMHMRPAVSKGSHPPFNCPDTLDDVRHVPVCAWVPRRLVARGEFCDVLVLEGLTQRVSRRNLAGGEEGNGALGGVDGWVVGARTLIRMRAALPVPAALCPV